MLKISNNITIVQTVKQNGVTQDSWISFHTTLHLDHKQLQALVFDRTNSINDPLCPTNAKNFIMVCAAI